MVGEITRKRFSFSGYVQGVGFRWRARRAAEAAGVTGWVRNETDGSVTMELQGRIEAIEQVLDTIERGLYIQIAGMDVRTIPPQDGERGFAVKDDRW